MSAHDHLEQKSAKVAEMDAVQGTRNAATETCLQGRRGGEYRATPQCAIAGTFAAARPDFAAIAAWIPQGASVLDLGCGDGSLLRYLRSERGAQGYGVEISDAGIVACIQNQVSVIQNDLESGLADFESDSFDYVILSQTLQATRHTEALMKEILRVGRCGIVSFPNFGYWRARLNVLLGNMPVSDDLPYQWYDTPNVHLCTLHDFEMFCAKHAIHILERRVMTGEGTVNVLPNLLGSTAVYRFQRKA